MAPALIIQSMLVAKTARPEHSTEAFTWSTSALLVGRRTRLGRRRRRCSSTFARRAALAAAAALLGALGAALRARSLLRLTARRRASRACGRGASPAPSGRRAPSLPNSSSCERSSSFQAPASTRVELGELRRRQLLQARPVQILVARHDAERRFDALRAALAALDDPFQHAHVLAEARPDELAVRVAAEPVDAENLRRLLHRAGPSSASARSSRPCCSRRRRASPSGRAAPRRPCR